MNYIILSKAAEYCEYSQEYLSLRARSGNLKAKKIGRNWFTTKEWLEQYLNKNGKSFIIKSDIEAERSSVIPLAPKKKRKKETEVLNISKQLRSVASWSPVSFLRKQNILDANKLKKSLDFYRGNAFNATKKIAAVSIGLLIIANIAVISIKNKKVSQFATLAGREMQAEVSGFKSDFDQIFQSLKNGAEILRETPQNFSSWINALKINKK